MDPFDKFIARFGWDEAYVQYVRALFIATATTIMVVVGSAVKTLASRRFSFWPPLPRSNEWGRVLRRCVWKAALVLVLALWIAIEMRFRRVLPVFGPVWIYFAAAFFVIAFADRKRAPGWAALAFVLGLLSAGTLLLPKLAE